MRTFFSSLAIFAASLAAGSAGAATLGTGDFSVNGGYTSTDSDGSGKLSIGDMIEPVFGFVSSSNGALSVLDFGDAVAVNQFDLLLNVGTASNASFFTVDDMGNLYQFTVTSTFLATVDTTPGSQNAVLAGTLLITNPVLPGGTPSFDPTLGQFILSIASLEKDGAFSLFVDSQGAPGPGPLPNVPLPASLPLILAGFGALGLVRKFKRKI